MILWQSTPSLLAIQKNVLHSSIDFDSFFLLSNLCSPQDVRVCVPVLLLRQVNGNFHHAAISNSAGTERGGFCFLIEYHQAWQLSIIDVGGGGGGFDIHSCSNHFSIHGRHCGEPAYLASHTGLEYFLCATLSWIHATDSCSLSHRSIDWSISVCTIPKLTPINPGALVTHKSVYFTFQPDQCTQI